ncbi:Uncharacterised protein [Vibrio cholerae]|nr:Uncharacterised protein [Vibrio cholerae]
MIASPSLSNWSLASGDQSLGLTHGQSALARPIGVADTLVRNASVAGIARHLASFHTA